MLARYKGEIILPAEKNVVQYPAANRTPGMVVLTDRRLIFQNSRGKVPVSLRSITAIDKAPKGWCPGEENRAFSVDFTMEGDRYKVVVFLGPLTRDMAVERIRREMVGSCRIYFKYPAIQGGVMDNSDNWTRGGLILRDKDMIILGGEKKVTIPYDSIVDYGRNLFIGDSRGMPTITIINHTGEEDVGLVVIGESHNLSVFEDYLKDITDKITLDLDLDEDLNKLLFVLNTGISDEDEIAKIMDIPVRRVEKLMDRLIQMRLVKLVRIKRDVELTRGSIRYINQKIRDGIV